MSKDEDRYHQIRWNDSPLVREQRWVKVGLAFIGASCLVLLSIIVTRVCTATSTSNETSQATNLYFNGLLQSQPKALRSWPASLLPRHAHPQSWSPSQMQQLHGKGEGTRMVQARAADEPVAMPRRSALEWLAAAATALHGAPVWAEEDDDKPKTDSGGIALKKIETPDILCDPACRKKIDSLPRQKLQDGLEYVELKKTDGVKAPIGYQAVINYEIFTSPDAEKPYSTTLTTQGGSGAVDTRVGAGNLIKGMEYGLVGMKVGEIRRLFIPGELSWPKGLPASPGKPRIAPNSPVVVDLQLLYVPGLDDD